MIFGIPILLVGGMLLLAFGSGGWFNRQAEEKSANLKFTKLGNVMFLLMVLALIGGFSLVLVAPDTSMGRFMAVRSNRYLYAWSCYLFYGVTVVLCELSGRSIFKKTGRRG